jgi:hypothetical protein
MKDMRALIRTPPDERLVDGPGVSKEIMQRVSHRLNGGKTHVVLDLTSFIRRVVYAENHP